jgi:hypothetical protein
MKKNALRIILVVTLATTMLIGTVASVEAKPFINVDAGSLLLWDNDSDGSYGLWGTATLYDKRVDHYAVEWFHKDGTSWESLGIGTYDLTTPSKTGQIMLFVNYELDDSYIGDEFFVRLYLTNPNYKLNMHRIYQGLGETVYTGTP